MRIKLALAIIVISLVTFFILFLSVNREQPIYSSYNIVLITVDALRYDHLGAYGYGLNTSPNIDRISQGANVYLNAISQVPMTYYAAYSIFSGKYPDKIDLYRSDDSFVWSLKKQNFSTLGVVGTNILDKHSGFQRGFDEYYDIEDIPTSADKASLNSSAVMSKLLEAIKDKKDDKKFIWLHFKDPHLRYSPPLKYKKMFYNSQESSNNLKVNSEWWNGYEGIPKFGFIENLTDMREYIALYDGEIRSVDDQLGSLFNYLKSIGQYDNTMIVIVGLHGESLGEHGYFFIHSSLLDEANIHVPLIIKNPNQKAGKRIKKLISLTDICSILFGTYKEGISIAQLKNRNLFLENVLMDWPDIIKLKKYYPKRYGLRTENDKLIFLPYTNSYEYYNLANDPFEKTNLINVSDNLYYQLRISSMKSILKNYQITYGLIDKYEDSYYYNYSDSIYKINVLGNYSDYSSAKSKIASEIYKVKGIYSNDYVPYSGVLTKENECPKRYMPIFYEGNTSNSIYSFYISYTNERFGLGVCDEGSISFRQLVGWIYYQELNEIHKVGIYFPADSTNDMLISEFNSNFID